MTDFKGKKIAFLGLAVDNKDCLPWLKKRGAKITILDEAKGDKFENLDQYDLLVRSPGIYRFRPELVKTKTKITSKIKIFFDVCPCKIIGVTGTKGKGTTATLIYQILKDAGKDVYLGGNIGAGVFDLKLTKSSWVVLELSSFQLIDLTKSPHIAVVLMTTSEHLNWHSSLNEYLNAKKSMVAYQTKNDFVIVNKDYPNSLVVGNAGNGKKVYISSKDAQNIKTQLRGEHNKENIAAAMAVAKILKINPKKAIASFSGLEHRLEKVAVKNGVTFYNDSFSTTPETAIAAIKSFSEPLIIILGGSSKNSDFSLLGKTIDNAKNIKEVILIGVEGKRIGESFNNKKKTFLEGNMENIVKTAYNKAISGDIVLLSPACASFDMFKSYKDRGEQFKKAVANI